MGKRRGSSQILGVVLSCCWAVTPAACGEGTRRNRREPRRECRRIRELTINVPAVPGDGALWGKTELATRVAAGPMPGGIKVACDTCMVAVKAYDNQWDPRLGDRSAQGRGDGIRFIVSWSGRRSPRTPRRGEARSHVRLPRT
jgi:hypothetical protein